MPKVIPVGPLLPSSLFSKSVDKTETNTEADESIMQFLDTHPPQTVVYIAFGSVALGNMDKLFEEAALGLEASGQPFLWAEATVNLPNSTSVARSFPPGSVFFFQVFQVFEKFAYVTVNSFGVLVSTMQFLSIHKNLTV